MTIRTACLVLALSTVLAMGCAAEDRDGGTITAPADVAPTVCGADGCDDADEVAAEWLTRTTAHLSAGGSIEFTAHVHVSGNETVVTTGTGSISGYRATNRSGAQAAGAPVVQEVEARDGTMRVRTESGHAAADGTWDEIDDGGGSLGLTAFHADGTDFVTILEELSIDHTVDHDSQRVPVRADLAVAFRALLGWAPVDEQGRPVIPDGTDVTLMLEQRASEGWRIHVDGTALHSTLQELDIDPSGQLRGVLTAMSTYVDYDTAPS